MRGTFTYATNENGDPVTRVYYAVDEATALQVAGVDGGRACTTVAEIHYVSPGRTGQTWRCYGLDSTFARVDGSLTSAIGPWTDLSLTAGLPDTSLEDSAMTLWVRLVAKRWAGGPYDVESPDLDFRIVLGVVGKAGIEDIVISVTISPAQQAGAYVVMQVV